MPQSVRTEPVRVPDTVPAVTLSICASLMVWPSRPVLSLLVLLDLSRERHAGASRRDHGNHKNRFPHEQYSLRTASRSRRMLLNLNHNLNILVKKAVLTLTMWLAMSIYGRMADLGKNWRRAVAQLARPINETLPTLRPEIAVRKNPEPQCLAASK